MTISLNLRLPYGWSKHRPVKWFSSHAHGPIGKHKGWEWQTDYFGWTNLFGLDIDLIPTGSDHAGIGISLTILGFMVDAKIYDSRHWDQEAGTWEKYDEDAINFRISQDEKRRQNELELARQLVADDDRKQARLSAEEWLETPQGQNFLASKVKAKLDEQKNSKADKKARGEAYRAANAAKAADLDWSEFPSSMPLEGVVKPTGEDADALKARMNKAFKDKPE